MNGRRVVVIGGGHAGLSVIKALAGKGFDVVLVERRENLVFRPGLTFVAAGLRRPEELLLGLDGVDRFGARLVKGEAIRVDPGERVVVLSDGSRLGYDYLVLAVGGEPWDGGVPGLRIVNLNPWSLEGAAALAEKLRVLPAGARVVVGAFKPPYPCPPAPFELAGLLAAVSRGRFRTTMVFFEEKPLPKLGREVSGALEDLLARLEVEFLGGFTLDEVDVKGKALLGSHGRQGFDVLALVPPFRPPRLLAESGLSPEGSWPVVEPWRGFRHPRYDDVYIVGDAAMPGLGAPMSGFLAGHSARAAAKAIAGDESSPGRAYAECFIDVLVDGVAAYCDFTDLIYSGGGPHCHVIAEGGLAGAYKRGYEAWWRDSIAPPQT